MGKRVANHLHRYKKVNLGNDEDYFVYRCMKPACSHYLAVKLVENKLCECNRCHEAMVMTKEAMQLTKPHCADCVKRKASKDVEALSKFLSGTTPGTEA